MESAFREASMPWREVSKMDERREFIRLAMQEGTNRRELCRRFGIHPDTGYKWLGRRSADEALADRCRRPHSSPSRTEAAIEARILAVRDEHPAWGARKIARCLERDGIACPAHSTVHEILRRHGRIVPPVGGPVAGQRFEKPAPNLLWQMDFKGHVPLADGNRCHPLTVIDSSGQHWTRLGVWLLKLGVAVLHSRPYHPQSRGKNERFHRTLKAEVFALNRFRNLVEVQRAFDAWRTVYNLERPHQALDQEVPASRYRPSIRSMPDRLPNLEYDEHEIVRSVSTTKDYISFKGRLWLVPRAFRGERVAVRALTTDGQYGVFFGAFQIATIDLTNKQCVGDVSEQVSVMSPG
jgi:transposase InsO family protein